MSVMIMGFSLGACILSFSLAMRVVSTGSNQMIAMHAARYELECLRTNAFTNSIVFATTNTTFANAYGSGWYVVTNINSATKNITVSVSYLNRLRGGNLTNSLATSITSTLH